MLALQAICELLVATHATHLLDIVPGAEHHASNFGAWHEPDARLVQLAALGGVAAWSTLWTLADAPCTWLPSAMQPQAPL